MTKKDYELIARLISENSDYMFIDKHDFLNALVIAFKNDNPLFNEVKFRKAITG